MKNSRLVFSSTRRERNMNKYILLFLQLVSTYSLPILSPLGSPKTPGTSCATPGAFIKVKIDDLKVLKASDIDQNLKFLHAFLSQNGYQFRFSNFGGLKTLHSLQISSQKLLDPLQLFQEHS